MRRICPLDLSMLDAFERMARSGIDNVIRILHFPVAIHKHILKITWKYHEDMTKAQSTTAF